MHQTLDLKVHYYGTPVVLISTRNPDGTANLAPMSSAWWLGDSAMLGMGYSSQTTANLRRERECVLNLPSSALVGAVDRLAMLTGTPDMSESKARKGYRYEPDKFGAAGLTPQAAERVAAPRVEECPIQLECRLDAEYPIGLPEPFAAGFHVTVLVSHVDRELVIPGTAHVDPVGWDPLIMKFCEFFGGGRNVHPSRLAEGWRMPHAGLTATAR